MNVEITTRHGKISESEDIWIRERMERLNKFSSGDHDAHVVVEHSDDRSTVEMNMAAPRGNHLSAHAEAPTLIDAVKIAETKLESQLHKLKDRLNDHRPG
ncbi:MAG: ribosomal subunit interface protein [Planctomycetota bacterium]|jgi:ribosomal subunit interface protein